MNPEKYGIITRLKNMSDFRELFYKDHVECDFKVFKNLWFESSCTDRYVNQTFQAKNCSCNNSAVT